MQEFGLRPFGSYARLIEDFNRADETPLASPWLKLNSGDAANVNLVSNAAASSASTTGSSYYSKEVFGPDLEMYFTVGTKPAATEQMGCVVRVQDAGGNGTFDGIQLLVVAASGTDTWAVTRQGNATGTTILTGSNEFASGDRYGLRVVGIRIEVWYSSQGGPWVMLDFVNNPFHIKQGFVAIRISATATRLDDVYVGTIPPGAIDLATLLNTLSGETTDSATVTVDLQASGTELAEDVDSATALVDLQASGTEAFAYGDSATVYLDLKTSGVEFIPPSNDLFANALALSTTLPATVTGQTNKDSWNETGEPNTYFSEDATQSVWYKFTPASTGKYKFKLSNVTLVGLVARYYTLAVYSGSAVNALTRLGRDEIMSAGTGEGDHPAVTVSLTSGTTYYIRVSSPWFTGETNPRVIDFDITVSSVSVGSAPANDDIANATDIGPDPTTPVTGDTGSATLETFETSSWLYTEPSVWLRFDVTANHTYMMEIETEGTNPNPDYYPYFEVYEILNDPIVDPDTDLLFLDSSLLPGGVGDIWTGATGYLSSSFPAETGIDLEAGKSYLIYVGNYNIESGQGGKFIFYPDGQPSAPPNDDVFSALQNQGAYSLGRSPFDDSFVGAEASQRAGTTLAGTAQSGEPSNAGFAATRSVWYFLDLPRAGTYKIWVESSVDCVLGIYDNDGTSGQWHGFNGGPGTKIDEDDDSGTGNWPEINHVASSFEELWVAVDSKTEGDFVLKFERQATGSPPANDDFANAQLVSTIPSNFSGTTVDATAETAEITNEPLGSGPKDTVWYKYVASFTGTVKIKATCDSANNDAYVAVSMWKGTTLANLVRHPDPPPGFSDSRGFYSHFDTPTELEQQALYLDVTSGDTYYIRVETESGGSEDFTIYFENQFVYLDLQASGQEVGPFTDQATAYLDLTASGTDEVHGTISDAATVYLTMTPGVAWETHGHEYTDSTTVYLDLVPLGGECFSRFHFAGEGEADQKWVVVSDLTRWSTDDATRWSAFVESQPGCD